MDGLAEVECPWPGEGVFTAGFFVFFSPFTWSATQRTTFSIVQKIMRRLPAVSLSIAKVAWKLQRSLFNRPGGTPFQLRNSAFI